VIADSRLSLAVANLKQEGLPLICADARGSVRMFSTFAYIRTQASAVP
jgi:hypothetical protein